MAGIGSLHLHYATVQHPRLSCTALQCSILWHARPWLRLIYLASFLAAVQQYPGAAHYANSVVVPDVEEGTILEILAAGYANVSSPLSLLVLYPLADTGVKSNADTAYSWRGNYIIYIWAFFTRTAGGPAVPGPWAQACGSCLGSW